MDEIDGIAEDSKPDRTFYGQSDIFFATLGTFVLDRIHFPNGGVEENVPGGSGTYGLFPPFILTCIAIIGARLFCPLPKSKSIGWMLNVGPDFPDSVRSWLSHLNITTVIREREDSQTTRGVVSYPHADYHSTPSQFQL